MAMDSTKNVMINDPRLVLDNALLTEAYANCRMFLRSWERFESLRAQPPPPPVPPFPKPMDDPWVLERRRWEFDLWGCVYAMVASARRLHGVLWEAPGCRAMREKYGLPTSGPLRDRDVIEVRDALEHAGNRLETFSRSSPGMGLSGWAVTSNPNSKAPPNIVRFRWLDLYAYVCLVRAEHDESKCNLRRLAAAVIELESKLPVATGGMLVGLPPQD
jgi:hypothetical protein